MVILVLAVVTLAALWYRLLVQEPSTASGGEAAMVKAVEQAQLFEPLLPLESPFPEEPEEPLEEPEQPAEPEPDQTVQPPEGTSSGSSVERVWELTNYYRSQYGAGTLTLDSTLCDDAATRAREIASYFSHTRLDGSQWYTVSSLAHGENIIMGTGMDADRAMTDWMNSQGHRDNSGWLLRLTGRGVLPVRPGDLLGAAFWLLSVKTCRYRLVSACFLSLQGQPRCRMASRSCWGAVTG